MLTIYKENKNTYNMYKRGYSIKTSECFLSKWALIKI